MKSYFLAILAAAAVQAQTTVLSGDGISPSNLTHSSSDREPKIILTETQNQPIALPSPPNFKSTA
jgi:hypothetical protein